MVEEAANLRIQRNDRVHVFRTQLEIEDVEILDDPLLSNGLRNNDDSPLYKPAQDHLGDAFLVRFGDGEQQFILEDVVPAFGEWPPRLDLNVVASAKIFQRRASPSRNRRPESTALW